MSFQRTKTSTCVLFWTTHTGHCTQPEYWVTPWNRYRGEPKKTRVLGWHVSAAIFVSLKTRKIIREYGDTFVLKGRLAAGEYDHFLNNERVEHANTGQISAG